MNLKLYYIVPDGEVVETTIAPSETSGYTTWLHSIVEYNPDTIFFYTIETTDIFEKELDFNTVVSYADNEVISHTYDPRCPPDCIGHLEACVHKRKENQG